MLTDERVDADVLEQLPESLRQQLTFERFHLHKPEVFQNPSRDPAFDPKYFPQNCGVMQLPCYWIERRHLYVFGAQHAADELSFFSGEGPHGCVLFPMHPASAANYRELLSKIEAKDAAEDGLRIWAVPTSSTRTLLAWPDRQPERAVFAKTSLHSPIFGKRRLHAWQVARSVGLSGLVQESLPELPDTLRYFPETFGMVPRQMPDSGTIIRSIPEEIKANRLLVAPLFSLMGGQHARPLFLRLMEQAGLQPMDFIEQVLCRKFARLWLEMTLRQGLILESHWQDLLLAMSPDLRTLDRFYYRDFEGLQVDWELRRRLGLSMPVYMPYSRAWHEAYGSYSYRYGPQLWYKCRISLQLYLHSVLSELEQMLRVWQERGLLGGARCNEGDLTAMFSRQVRELIQELFAVRVKLDYDIHRHLNRFLLLLLNIRKDLLGAAGTQQTVSQARM
jgi:hypothetical protein